MTIEQIIKDLEIIADSFKSSEEHCLGEMTWLNKHGFFLEREGLRYKQETFAQCWMELWNEISKIKKNTTINKEKEDGKA